MLCPSVTEHGLRTSSPRIIPLHVSYPSLLRRPFAYSFCFCWALFYDTRIDYYYLTISPGYTISSIAEIQSLTCLLLIIVSSITEGTSLYSSCTELRNNQSGDPVIARELSRKMTARWKSPPEIPAPRPRIRSNGTCCWIRSSVLVILSDVRVKIRVTSISYNSDSK